MDPGFKGCGCRLPNIKAEHREIEGNQEYLMVCQNHGCGAVWRQVGRSYVMIESPADPDRTGAMKAAQQIVPESKAEPDKDEAAEAEPKEKPEGDSEEKPQDLLAGMMAVVTERLKKDDDPETAKLVDQLNARIMGRSEPEPEKASEADTVPPPEEEPPTSAPEPKPEAAPPKAAHGDDGSPGFDDIVWPMVLKLREEDQCATSWSAAAFRVQGAADAFIEWARSGSLDDDDGLDHLAVIAAEVQCAAEHMELVTEDCVNADDEDDGDQ